MEWLANLTYKPVLITAVMLLLLRAALIRSRRESFAVARELTDATLIAVVVVFLLIRPLLFQAYYIPSPSMRPTLRHRPRYRTRRSDRKAPACPRPHAPPATRRAPRQDRR